MIGLYAEILSDMDVIAKRLGFDLSTNEDFYAFFRREDGWGIELAGDRASYPSFTISVIYDMNCGTARHYAVWVLMKHFANSLPKIRVRPTAENQLWFLENFADAIFNCEADYREAYSKLETEPL